MGKFTRFLETCRAHVANQEPQEKPYWFGIVMMLLFFSFILVMWVLGLAGVWQKSG